MGKNILIYSTQNSILGLQLIYNLHTCELNLLFNTTTTPKSCWLIFRNFQREMLQVLGICHHSFWNMHFSVLIKRHCFFLTRENLFCAIYPCRAKWPLLLVILGIWNFQAVLSSKKVQFLGFFLLFRGWRCLRVGLQMNGAENFCLCYNGGRGYEWLLSQMCRHRG